MSKLPEPFAWLSVAAYVRLAEAFPEGRKGGRTYALAIYVALMVLATEQKKSDHAGIVASRRQLAAKAGVSPQIVDAYTERMAKVGLLTKTRRSDDKTHLANRWTLTEPSALSDPTAQEAVSDPSSPSELPPTPGTQGGSPSAPPVVPPATNGGSPKRTPLEETKENREEPPPTAALVNGAGAGAIEAMHERGISNPEELLQFASPAAVLGACAWWDLRKGVGPGLLAKKIRQGGIEPTEPPSTVDCEPADETHAANWEQLLERLRAVRPEWSPAFAGSHAHGLTADGHLNIAVRPDALGWVRGRCANGHLTQLTHLTNLGLPPIAFVGCERATAVSEPGHG